MSEPRVFIAYRRADARGWARAIHDRLRVEFSEEQVFRDIDRLRLGRDFVDQLDEHLATCGYVLALIGPNWLNAADDARARKLDDPNDILRKELATALRRHIPIVPILVDGARLPAAEHLPRDLKGLHRMQSLTLTDEEFHERMNRLVRDIREAFGTPTVMETPDAAVRSVSPAAELPSLVASNEVLFDGKDASMSASTKMEGTLNAFEPASPNAHPSANSIDVSTSPKWQRKLLAVVSIPFLVPLLVYAPFMPRGQGNHSSAASPSTVANEVATALASGNKSPPFSGSASITNGPWESIASNGCTEPTANSGLSMVVASGPSAGTPDAGRPGTATSAFSRPAQSKQRTDTDGVSPEPSATPKPHSDRFDWFMGPTDCSPREKCSSVQAQLEPKLAAFPRECLRRPNPGEAETQTIRVRIDIDTSGSVKVKSCNPFSVKRCSCLQRLLPKQASNGSNETFSIQATYNL